MRKNKNIQSGKRQDQVSAGVYDGRYKTKVIEDKRNKIQNKMLEGEMEESKTRWSCGWCGWEGDELKTIMVDSSYSHDLFEVKACPECGEPDWIYSENESIDNDNNNKENEQ